MVFLSFDYERTWYMLFQERVVRTTFLLLHNLFLEKQINLSFDLIDMYSGVIKT